MARTNRAASSAITGVSMQVMAGDAALIITPGVFAALPWWEKLSKPEQDTVLAEGQNLAQSMLINGASRLAIGEHLTALQGVLEPHNLFGRFLKNFNFSKRSAYRRIAEFKNAKANLPEPVLKAAMARGVAIAGENEQKPLGVFTEAVKRLPPPTNASPEQADTWLTQVQQVRKDVRQQEADAVGTNGSPTVIEPMDAGTGEKEVYRVAERVFNRIPSRQRKQFIQGLVGKLMTLGGIAVSQSFVPQSIPEDFKIHRGRPASRVASA